VKFSKGDLVGRTYRSPSRGIVLIPGAMSSTVLWLSGAWEGKRFIERNKELSKLKVESA
jgi:hypothetical protein